MSSKTAIREIPGLGFVKAAAILDAETSALKCYRLGGVPYAKPLDASQRWKRAEPLPADYGYGSADAPTDFTGWANACPQTEYIGKGQMSEDCLQLNVWVPPGEPPKGGWPVMFYIRTLPPLR